jgi:hypothetical protein
VTVNSHTSTATTNKAAAFDLVTSPPHAACVVQLTVLEYTTSREHRFKVSEPPSHLLRAEWLSS